jgi:octaprenyl-diphosphate synthase
MNNSVISPAAKLSNAISHSDPTEIFTACIALEIEQHQKNIQNAIQSDVPLVEQVANYVLMAGGKRLRPILHLLLAKAIAPQANQEKAIGLSVILELIHTATLLHDEVN